MVMNSAKFISLYWQEDICLSKNYYGITLESALPLPITFEVVSRIFLENSSFVKVSGLVLFRPYYLFEHKLDSSRIDREEKLTE